MEIDSGRRSALSAPRRPKVDVGNLLGGMGSIFSAFAHAAASLAPNVARAASRAPDVAYVAASPAPNVSHVAASHALDVAHAITSPVPDVARAAASHAPVVTHASTSPVPATPATSVPSNLTPAPALASGCASPSSFLSPMATPFFPTPALNGRPKVLRWADSNNEDADDLLLDDNAHDVDDTVGDNGFNICASASYIDMARRSPPSSDPSPSRGARQAPLPEVQGPSRRNDRRRQHPAQKTCRRVPKLVVGLPHRGRPSRHASPPPQPRHPRCPRGTAAGSIPIHLRLDPWEEAAARVPIHKYTHGAVGIRIPVHLRLEPRVPVAVARKPHRHGLSPPDSEGWSEVLPRQVSGASRPHSAAPQQYPAPRRSLPT